MLLKNNCIARSLALLSLLPQCTYIIPILNKFSHIPPLLHKVTSISATFEPQCKNSELHMMRSHETIATNNDVL